MKIRTVILLGLLAVLLLIATKRPRVLFFFTEMDYSDTYNHTLQVPTPCLVTKFEIILSPPAEPTRGRAAVWVSCL
jgi:hypothetical protein